MDSIEKHDDSLETKLKPLSPELIKLLGEFKYDYQYDWNNDSDSRTEPNDLQDIKRVDEKPVNDRDICDLIEKYKEFGCGFTEEELALTCLQKGETSETNGSQFKKEELGDKREENDISEDIDEEKSDLRKTEGSRKKRDIDEEEKEEIKRLKTNDGEVAKININESSIENDDFNQLCNLLRLKKNSNEEESQEKEMVEDTDLEETSKNIERDINGMEEDRKKIQEEKFDLKKIITGEFWDMLVYGKESEQNGMEKYYAEKMKEENCDEVLGEHVIKLYQPTIEEFFMQHTHSNNTEDSSKAETASVNHVSINDITLEPQDDDFLGCNIRCDTDWEDPVSEKKDVLDGSEDLLEDCTAKSDLLGLDICCYKPFPEFSNKDKEDTADDEYSSDLSLADVSENDSIDMELCSSENEEDIFDLSSNNLTVSEVLDVMKKFKKPAYKEFKKAASGDLGAYQNNHDLLYNVHFNEEYDFEEDSEDQNPSCKVDFNDACDSKQESEGEEDAFPMEYLEMMNDPNIEPEKKVKNREEDAFPMEGLERMKDLIIELKKKNTKQKAEKSKEIDEAEYNKLSNYFSGCNIRCDTDWEDPVSEKKDVLDGWGDLLEDCTAKSSLLGTEDVLDGSEDLVGVDVCCNKHYPEYFNKDKDSESNVKELKEPSDEDKATEFFSFVKELKEKYKVDEHEERKKRFDNKVTVHHWLALMDSEKTGKNVSLEEIRNKLEKAGYDSSDDEDYLYEDLI